MQVWCRSSVLSDQAGLAVIGTGLDRVGDLMGPADAVALCVVVVILDGHWTPSSMSRMPLYQPVEIIVRDVLELRRLEPVEDSH